MTIFDADILRELQEVAIRTEKHPNTAVVIWVAVADEEIFVRSVRGTKGRWYRDLPAGDPATLEFAGRQVAVQAIPVSDPLRSPGPAKNIRGSTSRAPTRRRWCAPTSCRPHCGSNRADQPPIVSQGSILERGCNNSPSLESPHQCGRPVHIVARAPLLSVAGQPPLPARPRSASDNCRYLC